MRYSRGGEATAGISVTMVRMFRRWAFLRRVAYGTGFLAVLTLFGVGVYYGKFYTAPTCFDGVQNGNERAVDCGGACVRVCALDVQPLRIVWAESFKIVDGQYNAVAYVENNNSTIGTPSLGYTFKLYDHDGLIVERKGKTALPMYGTYPLFEGRIFTGERIPTRTELTFDSDVVWLPGTMGTEQFSLIKRDLMGADSDPRLVAEVRNNALDEAKNVEIIATIFDTQKHPLTASRTVVDYFPGRSNQNITFTWPEPIAKTLRSCEVPTDVMLAIDLSGSMNDDGGKPPEPVSSVLSAAEAFVTRLNTHDMVGLVTFATNASLISKLSNDIQQSTGVISHLSIAPADERGSTNTGDAIKYIREEMSSSRHNKDARKVAILLTDGLTNAPGKTPEAYALAEAEKLKALDVQVFTIGLGTKLNETFLKDMASSPLHYYKAPSIKEVNAIYTQITKAICEDGVAVIEVIPKVETNFAPLR